jgi:hypothetical protein
MQRQQTGTHGENVRNSSKHLDTQEWFFLFSYNLTLWRGGGLIVECMNEGTLKTPIP